MTFAERTREAGDALEVTRGRRTGWVVFRDVDLTGVGHVELTVARGGSVRVEVRDGRGWRSLGTASLADRRPVRLVDRRARRAVRRACTTCAWSWSARSGSDRCGARERPLRWADDDARAGTPPEVVHPGGLARAPRSLPHQRRPVPVGAVEQARLRRPAPDHDRADVRAGAQRHPRLPRGRAGPGHARDERLDRGTPRVVAQPRGAARGGRPSRRRGAPAGPRPRRRGPERDRLWAVWTASTRSSTPTPRRGRP